MTTSNDLTNVDFRNAKYLTSFVSPHLSNPEILSIATCLFVCNSTGNIVTANVEIPRGYMADGTVPGDFLEAAERKREEIRLENIVNQRIASGVQSELERLNAARAAATRATGEPVDAGTIGTAAGGAAQQGAGEARGLEAGTGRTGPEDCTI